MDITIDGFHSWMWKGKFVKSIIYVHTLHKCRGLYLMKCHREILQNSSYFWSMKIYVFFKGYLFCTKVACFINKKTFEVNTYHHLIDLFPVMHFFVIGE